MNREVNPVLWVGGHIELSAALRIALSHVLPPRPRSVVEAQRELAPRVRRGDCAIRSAEPGRRSHGAEDWSARRRDTPRGLFIMRP